MDPIRPAAAHRETVLGSTRKISATCRGVSSRSGCSMGYPPPLCRPPLDVVHSGHVGPFCGRWAVLTSGPGRRPHRRSTGFRVGLRTTACRQTPRRNGCGSGRRSWPTMDGSFWAAQGLGVPRRGAPPMTPNSASGFRCLCWFRPWVGRDGGFMFRRGVGRLIRDVVNRAGVFEERAGVHDPAQRRTGADRHVAVGGGCSAHSGEPVHRGFPVGVLRGIVLP